MHALKKIVPSRKTRHRVTCQLLVVCLMTPGIGMMGCDSGVGFLGLQDYQRDLLFGVGALAIALLSEGQPGPAGPAGPPGPAGEAPEGGPVPTDGGTSASAAISCWDINGNGEGDPEEDVNGDGKVGSYYSVCLNLSG